MQKNSEYTKSVKIPRISHINSYILNRIFRIFEILFVRDGTPFVHSIQTKAKSTILTPRKMWDPSKKLTTGNQNLVIRLD